MRCIKSLPVKAPPKGESPATKEPEQEHQDLWPLEEVSASEASAGPAGRGEE